MRGVGRAFEARRSRVRRVLDACTVAMVLGLAAGGTALRAGHGAPGLGDQESVTSQATPNVRVRIETTLGSFDVEVDEARAPVTAGNFLRYVDGGFYDGGQVHRSARLETQAARPVKIEVIQASIDRARDAQKFGPISLERTSMTGLSHRDGAISMARDAPDSAQSDFFVCIGDQLSLDYGGARNPDGQGFAAFGRVIAGMDVVRAIHKSPADGEKLTPPVRIVRARRLP